MNTTLVDLKAYASARLGAIVAIAKRPDLIADLPGDFLRMLDLDVENQHEAGIMRFASRLEHYLRVSLDDAADDPEMFTRQVLDVARVVYKSARRAEITYSFHNYLTPQELALCHNHVGVSGIEGMIEAPDPYKPIILQEQPEVDKQQVIKRRGEIGKISVSGDYYGFSFMVKGYLHVFVDLGELDETLRTVRDPMPEKPYPLIPGEPAGTTYSSVLISANFPYKRD